MAQQFIDLTDLSLFKELQDGKVAQAIAAAEAQSLHTVAIEGTTLKFYKEKEPVGTATPAYSIDLPETDLSGLITKIANATGGKVVVSKADGTVEESTINVENVVVDSDLAAVATTGKAENVAIDDTKGLITATTVEGAIEELAELSAGGVASKTVYLKDESEGQSTYAKVYKLYQGDDATDMTKNTLVGTINTPKDLVVQSGKVVDVKDGKDSDGTDVPAGVADGKYVKLTIQNQDDPIYINVADLVDVYTGGANAEATVSIDNANEITVAINKVAATKVIYKAAAEDAAEVTVSAAIADLQGQLDDIDIDGDIDAKIAELDATVSIEDTENTNPLNITVTEVDGKLTGVTGSIDANTFDSYGSATAAKNEVIGSASDEASAVTLYGVKAYADSLADNYATAAQGAKADTALQPADIETVPEASIRALFASTSDPE